MSIQEVKINSNLTLISVIIVLNAVRVISNHDKKPGIIYILIWTDSGREPFKWWSNKHKSFKSMNCTFQNCFLITDRDYFHDKTDYDVLLFNPLGMDTDLPLARSDNQLYIFVALESAAYLQKGEEWNWFFNYTWTYKLDSDISYPYFVVKNKRGEIIGPKVDVHWRNITRMRPTEKSVIEKLKNKTIAAAWFVTNCKDINKRLAYGHTIGHALTKFNLRLDVYGLCGNIECAKYRFEECLSVLENSYYFYLAFENSNCEDYVTEKLLTPLNHYTVPVVFGGANYSRFMPDGIYLNGNFMTEEQVAEKINEAIQDKQKYYDYFRWHRYYTYQFTDEIGEKDPLCEFCAFLNDESNRNHRRVYAGFTKWWNENGNKKDMDGIIVKFEDSGPHIKSVLSYRYKNVETKIEDAPSTLEQVNSFIGDLFRYYFDF